ncbi:MAG TPA: hypothetical protein VGE57_02180 [Solimonas sp.]
MTSHPLRLVPTLALTLVLAACGGGGGDDDGGSTGGTTAGETTGGGSTAGGSTGGTTGGTTSGDSTGGSAGGSTGGSTGGDGGTTGASAGGETTGDTTGGGSTGSGTTGSSVGGTTGGTTGGATTGGGTTGSSGGTAGGGAGGTAGGGTTGSSTGGDSAPDPIDLSGATGSFDLSTPDRAATAGVAILAVGLTTISTIPTDSGSAKAGASAPPKATTRCSEGGTRDETSAGLPPIITITDSLCRESGSETDGRIIIRVQRYTADGAVGGTFEFGVGKIPYRSEVLSPADARARSLLRGDGTFDFASSGAATLALRLQGAYLNLAAAGEPRADFEVGTASTRYSIAVSGDDAQRTLRMQGPYRLASDCGSGSGSLSTPTALTIDNDDGAVIAGQLMLSSGRATATYTYLGRNIDGEPEVRVDTAGGSHTYTERELAALCAL